MTKTQGNFRLRVAEGEFTDSQIVVMLGENGTGKTTFIRLLVLIQSYFFLHNTAILHNFSHIY
jgi:translation initiation factor RLI1